MEMDTSELQKLTSTSLQLTSLKGVPRVFKVKQTSLKIMWVVFIILFFIVALYFVINQTREYYAYPTVIDFDEVLPTPEMVFGYTTFPSMLLCNLKPVHIVDNSTTTNLMDYLKTVTMNITRYKRKHRRVTADEETAFREMYKVQGYFDFLPKGAPKHYGQSLEGFIVSCTITSNVGKQVLPCHQLADVELLVSPNYFNCYTITMKKEAIVEYQPIKISAILHLDDIDDYIHTDFSQVSNDLQSSGVIMQVHAGIVDVERRGIRLTPGTLSTVHFKMGKRKRLPPPYGDCTYNTDRPLLHRFKGDELPYSDIRCEAACIQTEVSERCGCLRSDAHAVHTIEETKLPYCGGPMPTFEERIERIQCSLNATVGLARNCIGKCRIQCTEMFVNTRVSTSKWPRHSQKLGFYREEISDKPYEDKYLEYQEIDDDLTSENVPEILERLSSLDQIEKNFLKVEAVLSDSLMGIVETKVKITEWDVISSVASFLNLFSGITLIVIVELIDYIIHLVYLTWTVKDKEREPEEGAKNSNGVANPVFDFSVHL